MARKPKRRPRLQAVEYMDATPERLAKGDYSEIVQTKVEGQSARSTPTRRFNSAKIDRLHKAGHLTWAQWYAGKWYAETAENANTAPPTVSGYGQGIGGSVTFYAFLPRNIQQLEARDKLHAARKEWPNGMQGFMERLLLRDALPIYGGRAAMRTVAEIRKGLDAMAKFLRIA
jgi:hypothetical protein